MVLQPVYDDHGSWSEFGLYVKVRLWDAGCLRAIVADACLNLSLPFSNMARLATSGSATHARVSSARSRARRYRTSHDLPHRSGVHHSRLTIAYVPGA